MGRWLILILLTAGLAFTVIRDSGSEWPDRAETTISVLRTIPKAFLVAQRREVLVVHHLDAGNNLAGVRTGIATLRVTIDSGIDLTEIERSGIDVRGEVTWVRIPAPEVLSITPDLNSFNSVTKSSVLWRIWDTFHGQSLESDLFQQITTQLVPSRHGAEPEDRIRIVEQLNRYSETLLKTAGFRIRFE